MKILIAGGAGYVGTELVKTLCKKHDITVLDSKPKAPNFPDVRYIYGDIRDFETVSSACKGQNAIFNLASLLATEKGNKFYETNVLGTRNLLDAAKQNNISKFVQMSTSMVYGIYEKIPCTEACTAKPMGPYGKSKLEAEQECERYAELIDLVILRPGPIVGPGRGGLFSKLFEQVKANKAVCVLGTGHNKFQFVHLRDVISACKLSLLKKGRGTFNLGAGDAVKVKEIMTQLIFYAKSRSKVVNLNPAFVRLTCRALNLLNLAPLKPEHYYIADKDYILSVEKATKELNWSPKFSTTQCILEAYEWFVGNT